jgi:hypothetical protein
VRDVFIVTERITLDLFENGGFQERQSKLKS